MIGVIIIALVFVATAFVNIAVFNRGQFYVSISYGVLFALLSVLPLMILSGIENEINEKYDVDRQVITNSVHKYLSGGNTVYAFETNKGPMTFNVGGQYNQDIVTTEGEQYYESSCNIKDKTWLPFSPPQDCAYTLHLNPDSI